MIEIVPMPQGAVSMATLNAINCRLSDLAKDGYTIHSSHINYVLLEKKNPPKSKPA